MMPPMDAGQTIHEWLGAGYGAYEGNQSYAPPPPPEYRQGPQQNAYDDEYVESLAQRLSHRMAQGPQSKIRSGGAGAKISVSMRLVLAIISVVMLIPLAAILVGGVGGGVGLVSFGAVCLAIFLINVVFNDHH